ncbi:MAG: hypothetical protein E6G27_10650 [Actinobacteria bacterium]|nr:MAG: hypothetical protein E6G27_10650 [Actinomycetota bacterium]
MSAPDSIVLLSADEAQRLLYLLDLFESLLRRGEVDAAAISDGDMLDADTATRLADVVDEAARPLRGQLL